jgi:hypothetical protein
MNKIQHLTCCVLLIALLLTGCASPYGKTSRLMQPAFAPAMLPPPGKTLVCIHRPRATQGYVLYTGIWDSTKLIADLGNGHSVAYVCEPGKHYFINRSAEVVGVVEADLLPDKTYDLCTHIAGAFVASFKLKPLKPGDKEYQKLPKLLATQMWVTPEPGAAGDYQSRKGKEVEHILQDFSSGDKNDRLQHLSAEDHR